MDKRLLFTSLVFSLFFYQPVFAKNPFQTPAPIADEVRFWKTVFGTYDHDQVLLHDERYLNIVYRVLDFSTLGHAKGISFSERKKIEREQIKRSEKKIVHSLMRLASGLPQAHLTEEEKYFKQLFEEVQEPRKYDLAMRRIRVQRGLRNSFIQAVAKSASYMGDIEAIFKEQGLPKELSALIFVESMFNPLALSEVGASGLWQFMPETGGKYVAMNDFLDDRNDPMNASKGAAFFLKDLYRLTGSWALAINAYHSGGGRLLRATKRLKTRDIATIIQRFDDPHYGFESRNYFPKFLAVLDIYKNRELYLGPISGHFVTYDIVTTPGFVSLALLTKGFDIKIEELRRLNPALRPEVLTGKLPLPPHYPLKVPKGLGYRLANALDKK